MNNTAIYASWLVSGLLTLGATIGGQQWCANIFIGLALVLMMLTIMTMSNKELVALADLRWKTIKQVRQLMIADYVIDSAIVFTYAWYGYKLAAITMSLMIVLSIFLAIKRYQRLKA